MNKRILFFLLSSFLLCAHYSSAQIIEGSDFICIGGVTELSANVTSAQSYQWSSGQQTQSIAVDVPGWYFLDVVDSLGFLLMDSIFLTLSPLPDNTISVLGPETICLGSSTTLEVQPNLLYQWSNGEDDMSINPNTSGTYFCILTDPYSGCQSTTDTITIGVYEFLDITVEPETVNCIGDTLTLTSPEADSYIWNTGETTQSIEVFASGTYSVNVDNGVCDTDLSQNVIYNANPIINLGPDQYFCSETTVTLCGPTGMQEYSWCSGETTECITVSADNSTYCLSVVSFSGCEASDSVLLGLNLMPDAEINVATGSQNACVGDTVILSSPLSVVSWSTGDIIQSIEVTEAGTYWLLATDANGCPTDTGFIEIAFNDIPEAIIYSNEDLLQCPSEDFSLILSTDDYESYLWNDFAVTQEVTINETGEYYVIVSDEFGCTDTSDLVTVGFYNLPILGALAGNDMAAANSTEEYILTNFANTTYYWTVEGGTIVGDSTDNSISVEWSQDYTGQVCGWIESAEGCLSDTSCLDINLTTDVSEFDKSFDIEVWPNPVQESIHWKTSINASEVSIIDLTGLRYSLEEVGSLSAGLYYLEIIDNYHRIYHSAFIKL